MLCAKLESEFVYNKGDKLTHNNPFQIWDFWDEYQKRVQPSEITFVRQEFFQCFNIETKHQEELEDEIQVDLNPRAAFKEHRPTFDEPVVLV